MAEEKANQMKTVGDLLTRDLSRKIEEIIQVDQADEESVHAEITEYVATDTSDLRVDLVPTFPQIHESLGRIGLAAFTHLPQQLEESQQAGFGADEGALCERA
jgi:hypothetical protein